MRNRQDHVETALLRGISSAAKLDVGDREKPILAVEEIRTVDWASVTFIGARVTLMLRLIGTAHAVAEAFDALAARLPDWEFRIAGQIVADIELSPDSQDADGPNGDAAGNGHVPITGPFTVSRPFTVNILTIID
ncbi:hypothetical protein [Polymorphobacter sp.]|uniref:hypothetical protein n=1 Tax=Polymorphobacter sp. TaxID=1909290 RepID=UPI003F6F861A